MNAEVSLMMKCLVCGQAISSEPIQTILGTHSQCVSRLKEALDQARELDEIKKALHSFHRALKAFYTDGILQPWVVEMYLNAITVSDALTDLANQDGLFSLNQGDDER